MRTPVLGLRRPSWVAAGVAAAGVFVAAVAAAAPAAPLDRTRLLQTWAGEQAGEGFGWAIADVGDEDGDGARDAVVTAPFYSRDGSATDGRVYVESTGSGRRLHVFDGGPGEFFGNSASDAGDVDGDGVSDVLVGAPGGSYSGCAASGTDRGHAYVFSGRTGRLLHRWSGAHPGDSFGYAVAGAGDVDADGTPDLLVTAPCADTAGPDAGRAYLLSGRTWGVIRSVDGPAAHDLFGTAVDAVRSGAGGTAAEFVVGARNAGPGARGRVYAFSARTGRLRWAFSGDTRTADLGWFFVAGIPDVTGDGVDDVYAGDFDAGKDPSATAGRFYVLSGADGRRVYAVFGHARFDGMGPGRYAGDVDGDGIGDLVVGSYTSSAGAPFAGKVQLFSGRDGSLLRTIVGTVAQSNLGFDAVGVGDVDGDGHPDELVSAAGGDRVYLVAGRAAARRSPTGGAAGE